MRRGVVTAVLLLMMMLRGGTAARADAVLLLGEPINLLGWLTSTGHAALLLENVCSDDHLHLRMCRPGEPGTVLSRYEGVGGYDWIAMRPMPYLYAVEGATDAPETIGPAEYKALRDRFAAKHLKKYGIAKDDGDVTQLVGAAYRRRIIAIRLRTTPEQDERLMHWLNDGPNRSHFNLFYSNCADFTRRMLNVLYPGAVHRSFFFDAGITTPKQLASAMHRYAKRHPETGFEVSVIDQVPGDVARSGRFYGITESFVRTKPYLLPLAVLQPVGIGSVVVSAILDRRYSVHSELETAPRWPEGTAGSGLSGEEPGEASPGLELEGHGTPDGGGETSGGAGS